MKVIVLLIFLISQSITFAKTSDDWGKTGHRTIGLIAEKHLTKKAKKAIDALLNDASLATVSTYADEIRSDKAYNAYAPWHYVNLASDESYATAEKNPKGDIVTAIQFCIEQIKNTSLSKEKRAFHLKLLVHFIGDLHQPLHAGRKEDKGGNSIKLKWFGRSTNLHRVWDSDIIDDYQMSYTEMAKSLTFFSKQQRKAIAQTSLLEMVAESQAIATEIYADIEGKERLGYKYSYKYLDTVKQQLLKGGLRLAETLNTIFG